MNRLRCLGFPLIIATAVGVLIGINGCSVKPKDTGFGDKPGPKVLASFPPIYCFVANVAGNDANVKSLLTTKGPHSHGDPTSEHLKLAKDADVMFINGLGIDEKFADKVKESCGKSDLNVVELGEKIDEKKLFKAEEEPEEKGKKHDHKHDHGAGSDPHVWLSPIHARTMVAAVRDELKKIDPAHAAGYDSRAADFIAKLEKLEKDGIDLLKDKKERKIIAFHDSLRYFADCYGITIADFLEIEPGEEPSAKRLGEIINLCVKEKIRVIAVEPQFPSSTSAGTVLRELKNKGIDAVFVVVDPLETADEGELKPELYERTMRNNLENLAKALK